ncbi:MAG TPA: bacillithiol biosynthesis cysteine-adding enzyme BshC [Gemmatimonadales bacterium]|jgi:bacillithiol biosynthesis cysteine-adding enzyme BshC
MLRVVSHPLGPLPPVAPRSAAWRADLDAALIPGAGIDDARRRLHQPDALVVTTGQQPGLFTGPLYSVHKALSAAALARALERRWRRPVVPVFWIAGDDHDFAEASTVTWMDAAGKLVDWSLPARPATAPQLPMSEEQLPAGVADGLSLLAASLPAGQPRDATLDWLRRHYVAGATLHRAFSGAMADLLAPFGVVCFDPTHRAAKQAQAPLLATALHRAAELDRALAALPEAGTGIGSGDGATLVFVTTNAGRERLLIDGKHFRTRRSGERFTRAEIDARLAREPERFSANVLLRPVVESALLPTVAYVAGPGEMAYLERQASVLYPLLDVARQIPVPRWSGTVVERWAERLLERLDLGLDAVLADDGRLARDVLERDFPGDAREAIDALRRQIASTGNVVAAAGKRIDPVLERAVMGRMRRLDQISGDVEKALLRHLRKRDDIAHAQYARLVAGLRPRGKPQERVLSAPSFRGRYGEAWLNGVFEAISAWADGAP